jgi:arylsulfatase A-like enzyme
MNRTRSIRRACSAAAALALSLAAAPAIAATQPPGHGHAQMVITLFMDGGHRELYTPQTTPTISGLAAHGVEYTNAQSGVPSDSFPGLRDSFTLAEHGGRHPDDRDIPLIIGGAIPHHGRVVHSPVTNLELAPTIAALLGVPFPSSQVPALPDLTPGR